MAPSFDPGAPLCGVSPLVLVQTAHGLCVPVPAHGSDMWQMLLVPELCIKYQPQSTTLHSQLPQSILQNHLPQSSTLQSHLPQSTTLHSHPAQSTLQSYLLQSCTRHPNTSHSWPRHPGPEVPVTDITRPSAVGPTHGLRTATAATGVAPRPGSKPIPVHPSSAPPASSRPTHAPSSCIASPAGVKDLYHYASKHASAHAMGDTSPGQAIGHISGHVRVYASKHASVHAMGVSSPGHVASALVGNTGPQGGGGAGESMSGYAEYAIEQAAAQLQAFELQMLLRVQHEEGGGGAQCGPHAVGSTVWTPHSHGVVQPQGQSHLVHPGLGCNSPGYTSQTVPGGGCGWQDDSHPDTSQAGWQVDDELREKEEHLRSLLLDTDTARHFLSSAARQLQSAQGAPAHSPGPPAPLPPHLHPHSPCLCHPGSLTLGGPQGLPAH